MNCEHCRRADCDNNCAEGNRFERECEDARERDARGRGFDPADEPEFSSDGDGDMRRENDLANASLVGGYARKYPFDYFG